MNSSSTIGELAKALTQAQAEMPFAPMNVENKFLKNKYADLGAVIETSRPILAKWGLSITQFPTSRDDGRIGVRSILIHSSGEWLEDSVFIATKDTKGLSDAQAAGVVITYLRRYSWSAIIGMYSDEDNDGELRDGEKAAKKQSAASNPTADKIQELWDNADKDLRNKFKPLFKEYEPKTGNPKKISDEEKQKELLAKMDKLIAEGKAGETK